MYCICFFWRRAVFFWRFALSWRVRLDLLKQLHLTWSLGCNICCNRSELAQKDPTKVEGRLIFWYLLMKFPWIFDLWLPTVGSYQSCSHSFGLKLETQLFEVMNILILSFLFAMAMGDSVGIRMAKSLGEGHATRAAFVARLGIIVSLIGGLVIAGQDDIRLPWAMGMFSM